MTDAEAEPLLGCRVLVAEDDSIIALDMELLLRDAGAEVFGPVKTTAAAVALAKTAPLIPPCRKNDSCCAAAIPQMGGIVIAYPH